MQRRNHLKTIDIEERHLTQVKEYVLQTATGLGPLLRHDWILCGFLGLDGIYVTDLAVVVDD